MSYQDNNFLRWSYVCPYFDRRHTTKYYIPSSKKIPMLRGSAPNKISPKRLKVPDPRYGFKQCKASKENNWGQFLEWCPIARYWNGRGCSAPLQTQIGNNNKTCGPYRSRLILKTMNINNSSSLASFPILYGMVELRKL